MYFEGVDFFPWIFFSGKWQHNIGNKSDHQEGIYIVLFLNIVIALEGLVGST